MKIQVGLVLVALLVCLSGCIASNSPAPGPATTPLARGTAVPPGRTPPAAPAAEPAPTVIPDPDRILVRLNQEEGIGRDYVPPDLVPVKDLPTTGNAIRLRALILPALKEMIAAAGRDGARPVLLSGYRSYDEQDAIYRAEVRAYGEAQASREVARPGHSEHQLGTTIDFTSAAIGLKLDQSFAQTAEGRWLADHAYKFGFVLSYPDGKEPVTKYMYEPWHYRYVGLEVARTVRAQGITLHEYLAARP